MQLMRCYFGPMSTVVIVEIQYVVSTLVIDPKWWALDLGTCLFHCCIVFFIPPPICSCGTTQLHAVLVVCHVSTEPLIVFVERVAAVYTFDFLNRGKQSSPSFSCLPFPIFLFQVSAMSHRAIPTSSDIIQSDYHQFVMKTLLDPSCSLQCECVLRGRFLATHRSVITFRCILEKERRKCVARTLAPNSFNSPNITRA